VLKDIAWGKNQPGLSGPADQLNGKNTVATQVEKIPSRNRECRETTPSTCFRRDSICFDISWSMDASVVICAMQKSPYLSG